MFQEESDSIERLHISASEAFTKFKGKSLDAKGIDFSDRLSKRIRTGYDARYAIRTVSNANISIFLTNHMERKSTQVWILRKCE